MKIEFDPEKRAKTLLARGLDFRDASRLFSEGAFTERDERYDYGEERFLTYGRLDGVAVVVVWTLRASARRVISMRRMHDEETKNVGLG